MAELDTMYRVMILYMLDRVEHPLTNTQITNFILDNDYTTYFNIQQIISDLISSELILAESTHSNTRYRLTEEGRKTLGFFSDKITKSIKNDIEQYLTDNEFQLKQETSAYADYQRASYGGYTVRCYIKEKTNNLLDFNLHVDTIDQAAAICSNWSDCHSDVYGLLMDMLLK